MFQVTAHRLICLLFILNICSTKGSAQAQTTNPDSVKTLRMLEETLEEIMEEKRKQQEQNNLQLEIDGLIVDQTITKIGKDFYDVFFSNWTAPSQAKNFTIIIKELPTPGLGTQITILVNESEVFKQQVQPRQDFIEALSGYAESVVSEYLINYENMKAQLEDEDQQGTGIF